MKESIGEKTFMGHVGKKKHLKKKIEFIEKLKLLRSYVRFNSSNFQDNVEMLEF